MKCMTIKGKVIVAAIALLSIVAGFLFIIGGIGLAVIPASIPIFGTAVATVSPIYLAAGFGLILLGGLVLFLVSADTLNTVGWSRGRHRGR